MNENTKGSVFQLIDLFESFFPLSGDHSHSVIEDFNIRNCDILPEIQRLTEEIKTNSLPEQDVQQSVRVTLHFLIILYAIPEEIRAKQQHTYDNSTESLKNDPNFSHWTDYMEANQNEQ